MPGKFNPIILILIAVGIAAWQTEQSEFTSLNLDSQYDYYNPVWSPTGDAIAFVRRGEDALSSDIWIAHADGTLTNVVPDNGRRNESITWSPDGKTIAYDSDAMDAQDSFIWLVQSDGSNNRQLASEPSVQNSPLWSRDGRYVAFISLLDRTIDLWIYDFEQNSARNLTADVGGAFGVKSWSAGSGYIVALHVQDNINELLQINVRNGEKVRLVDDGGYVNVSATHAFLVYIPLGQSDVVQYNTDARTTWQIINTPDIYEIAAVISPDSEYILISGRDDSGSQLSMYSTKTHERTTIVTGLCSGGMTINDGAWSPDSERFTFVCQDDVNADVWIVNRDGSNAINLTGE